MLQLFPEDPGFTPSRAAGAAAAAVLRRLVPRASGGWDVRNHDGTVFVDPGGNWSGVRCPSCGTDLDDWWTSAMDDAFGPDGFFGPLAVTTPCCAARTDLNALDYVWAAGFARYVLTVTDPDRDLPLPPADVQVVAEALGAGLRQVVARY